MNKTELTIDFFVVCFFLAVAYGVSLLLTTDIFISVILYLLLPAAYLCYRRPKNYRKIIIASVVLGLLAGMAYDFVAEFNNAYIVHYSNNILNYHIIGKTPIGDFIWAFLIPFFTIVFYEHFLDNERVTQFSRRFPAAAMAGTAIFLFVGVYFLISPSSRVLPYAYLTVGVISALPLVGLLFERRVLVHKVLLVSVFFFVLNLVFEVSAVTLRQWSFPGVYMGWINFAGVSFPIEELTFWIIPSSAVFVFCYEVLFDDNR